MSEERAPLDARAGALRRTSMRPRGSNDRAARVPHDGRCAYCGRSFGSLVEWKGKGRFLGLTFDHVIPLAAGGPNTKSNSVACCTVCNGLKGGRVFDSFADARLYVLSELERRGVVLLTEATPKPCPSCHCERCGAEFVSSYSRARFCSSRCRQQSWDEQHPRIEWHGAPRSDTALRREASKRLRAKARPGESLCEREGCMNRAVWQGTSKGFCSWTCRSATFDHPEQRRSVPAYAPEQARLEFAAEPVPVPHLSSTDPGRLTPNQDFVSHSTEPPEALPQGSPARRRGQGSTRITPAPATGEPYESARVWLLGRLQVGPVSTLELRCPPWRASQNAAQRVLELRNRQHDIRTVRVGRRTWYWLHVDGLPVGCVPEEE